MLILVVAMVTMNVYLMLILMLLQDNIFFYILTIKNLSIKAKQYKTQKKVNKVCQVSSFLKGEDGRQILIIA